MALKIATSLILVLLSAVICTGHPDGADDEGCKDLYPSHGYTAKSAAEGHAEGYRLVQDTEDYKPATSSQKPHHREGSAYVSCTVTLSSEASPFMGFLIKAFDENEMDVGSFRSTGPDSRAFSHCAGITHTWRDLKKRVVVQWLAPKDRSGKVHFKVTVVKQVKDFYHAIPSTLD